MSQQENTARGLTIVFILLLIIFVIAVVFLLLQLQWAGRRTETLEEDMNVQATNAQSAAMLSTQAVATYRWQWTLVWETKEAWENVAHTAATQAGEVRATATAAAATATSVRGTLDADITMAIAQAYTTMNSAESNRATAESNEATSAFVAQSNRATAETVQTLSVIERATTQAGAAYLVGTTQADAAYQVAVAQNAQYVAETQMAISQFDAYNSQLAANAARAQFDQYQTQVAAAFTGTASVPTQAPTVGRIVTAKQLGPGGCALEPLAFFTGVEDRIYVVAENVDLPLGTSFFARWYLNDIPFQDSTVGVADQEYKNICI